MAFKQSFIVEEVFTPTRPARHTFVERDPINQKLVSALRTPGKQVVVYGHSGSGKTTLLVNKLHQTYENHITTRCVSGMTFNEVLLDAFDRMGRFYDAEQTATMQKKGNASLQAEYKGIKALLGGELSKQSTVKKLRTLPLQLTAQNLAQFTGQAKCCWVLEDFHKIDSSERRRLSQLMKVFMDMSDEYPTLKIIAIGAVDTARLVVEYDAEMRNRVAEIYVPLMTNEEIALIPTKGEELLNIVFPGEIRTGIINTSDGLPAVCHQLCLNICYSYGIVETLEERLTFEPSALESALTQYLEDSSDTLKSAFDKALRLTPGQSDNDGELILKALLEFDKEGATRDEILSRVLLQSPFYSGRGITAFLKKLQRKERGMILRYDQASGRYSFIDSLHRVFAATYFELKRTASQDSPTIDPKSIIRAVRESVDRERREQGRIRKKIE